MEYIIAAPGFGLVVTRAFSAADARRIAREELAVGKLPKGTVVERYTPSNRWNV